MGIMSYNGGTVLAMAGKDSICIGCDLRYGEQMTTIGTDYKKIHKVADKVYVGMGGFASDAKTLMDKIEFTKSLYELREGRVMKPQVIANIISNLMYQKRFGSYFTEPLVAGLDQSTGKPFIVSMDVIGCMAEPKDFVCVGTGAEYLLGVCEGFWKENMTPDELFEATAQCLLSGLERDSASGWGAIIYTITKDKVVMKTIKARMD